MHLSAFVLFALLCCALTTAFLAPALRVSAAAKALPSVVRPTIRAAPSATRLSYIRVTVDENEPLDDAIKRFKRLVNQSGHMVEMRFRERWETAAEKRRRKAARVKQLQRMERTYARNERQRQQNNWM